MKIVVQTPTFTAQAAGHMAEDGIEEVVDFVARGHALASVLPETGGLRRLRFAGRPDARGAGYPVVTFYTDHGLPAFLLGADARGGDMRMTTEQKADARRSTAALAAVLRGEAAPDGEPSAAGLGGLDEALAHARGVPVEGTRVHHPIDVAGLRARLGLSADAFARRLGVPARTARAWEDGGSRPTGAARALLRVIAREPEAVDRALGAA